MVTALSRIGLIGDFLAEDEALDLALRVFAEAGVDLAPRPRTGAAGVSKVAMKASPLLLMRLTWLQVLLLPLPAYGLEFWIARRYLNPDPAAPWLTVECFDVGAHHWLVAAAAIGAGWILPRLFYRRAMQRLRGRARLEVDRGPATFRTPLPRVWRWPSETAAVAMAETRYATRVAATLAVIAGVELSVFFWLMPGVSFHCLGSGTHVYVPEESEHLLLVGLLVGVTVLLVPRRSAALRPIRGMLGARVQP